MEDFFLRLFETHPEAWMDWGYAIIFLTALAESILFIGIFIPGQIIIILAGFLIKLGMFDFWVALIAAALGAVIGDAVGFLIGKRYRHRIPEWLYNFIKKDDLAKTQGLIERHSIKSIFLGRLHSMTRTFAPFAAGTTGIGFKKFFAADFIAAIIWAFISLSIGYVFGHSFELAAAAIGKFILIATLITIALIFLSKFIYDQRHRVSLTDFAVIALCAASAYIFAITAQDIGGSKLLLILDISTVEIMSGLRSVSLTSVMTFITVLGDPLPISTAATILAGWLIWQKRYYLAFVSVLTISSGILVLNLLKSVFDKVRPGPGLVSVIGSSFPSGHAMMSTVLACILSHTVIRYVKSSAIRNILYGAVFTAAVCIGFSRVYLNVHWASDVLGGFSAGLFWATFMIAMTRLAVWIINRSKGKRKLPNLQ